jgi:protein-disulfide isomerase
MAKAIGLNTSKFNDCLDKETYKDKVNKDLQEGQKIGVNGTPASFINGESIPGAQPYATFKDLIEKKLSEK